MSEFYDEMADVATELLTEFGQSAIIVRNVVGTSIPGSGKPNKTTETDQVFAMEVDYDVAVVDGTSIKSTDKRVLVAPEGVRAVPKKGDKITLGGITYNIENASVTAPGGAPVMYEIQARA